MNQCLAAIRAEQARQERAMPPQICQCHDNSNSHAADEHQCPLNGPSQKEQKSVLVGSSTMV
jgi:hypothetical protein